MTARFTPSTNDIALKRIRQYIVDLRRNSSGGDDYPLEIMIGVADALEKMLATPINFDPLGKGSNRRSWHMHTPVSNEFKDLYQTNEMFRLYFDKILETPIAMFQLKAMDTNGD